MSERKIVHLLTDRRFRGNLDLTRRLEVEPADPPWTEPAGDEFAPRLKTVTVAPGRSFGRARKPRPSSHIHLTREEWAAFILCVIGAFALCAAWLWGLWIALTWLARLIGGWR